MKKLRPLISLKNASIRFGDDIIFPNTTFEILPGQQWMFLGVTGSGKSLFVSALRGKLVVDGDVEYCFDGDEDPDIDRHIGFVSFEKQRDLHSDENRFVQARFWSFDDSIAVREFLSQERVCEINPFEVNASKESSESYAKLMKQICRLLDIYELLDRWVDQLSNGESRRVLIAAALLRRPSILFLDSPFQGLDTDHQRKLREALGKLIVRGLHIVLVTADSDDSFPELTHYAVIDNFRIGETGPLRQFKTRVAIKPIDNKLKIDSLPSYPFIHKQSSVPVCMRNVSVGYGNNILLDNISWEVRSGQHWIITGHNGAGKSTLLSLITCDNPQAYSNDIEIFGKRFGNGRPISETRRLIGVISPELQACFPMNCTSIDAVCSGFSDSMGLPLQCGKKRNKIAFQWLRVFGLENFSTTKLSSLSDGNLRLVLLARALVKNPALLILDEPCQGLDLSYRKMILSVIDTVAGRKTVTVLYVTHNKHELPKCITHRLNLEKGRITSMGKLSSRIQSNA